MGPIESERWNVSRFTSLWHWPFDSVRLTFTPVKGQSVSKAEKYTQDVDNTKPIPPVNTSTAILSGKGEHDGKSLNRWDGWPDGSFQCDFTFHKVDEDNNLQVHWSTKTHGHHGGSDFSDSWEQGKKSHKECLGIIECDNPDCLIAIRPQTTWRGVNRQCYRHH